MNHHASIRKTADTEYIGKPILKTDNKSVREWYIANVSDIPNRIDKTQSLDEQSKQAFEMRNQIKREARLAMTDEETVKKLERTRPVPEWDELVADKMRRKAMTREQAIRDILETASKTNVNVNREFDL